MSSTVRETGFLSEAPRINHYCGEQPTMSHTSFFSRCALPLLLLGSIIAVAQGQGPTSDEKTLHVTVEPNVTLEVLDWGGTGTPVVLLAGLGNNAHIFNAFALKLSAHYHVYGITRRGFEYSSAPTPSPDLSNYSPDRLADDVMTVLRELKLERPILVGHSIAGEELSDIGTRFPSRVKALVYLDAGYFYAFDNPSHPDLTLTLNRARRELSAITFATPSSKLRPEMLHLANDTLPILQEVLNQNAKMMESRKDLPAMPPLPPAMDAILNAATGFGPVHCPVLAIYAMPDKEAPERKEREDQADAFAKAMPQAKVVRLEKAEHYVFLTNEAEVLKVMNDYFATSW